MTEIADQDSNSRVQEEIGILPPMVSILQSNLCIDERLPSNGDLNI